MKYVLRPYQVEASNAAVAAFRAGVQGGLIVCPTGAGKSLIIADIAYKLDYPLLIFQPSKEILEQNFRKLLSYGVTDCSIYSASFNSKEISRITFATIGSVKNHLDDFDVFKYVLIDEAHCVNANGGMYEEFIHHAPRSVVGLTASPYRLGSSRYGGSMLSFLTRTRPRIFKKVLYVCQTADLIKQGFLCQARYIDVSRRISFDIDNVRSTNSGLDYEEKSLVAEYERSNFYEDVVRWVHRAMHPKDGSSRKGAIVFTRFVKEAKILANSLPYAAMVSGDTPKRERQYLLDAFREGKIKVMANAQILTFGFDYPELDTVILARPTKSLTQYQQMVGRCVRPFEGKEAWVVDLCGTYSRFGGMEDLKIDCPPGTTLWRVTSRGRQLTNVTLW